MNIRTILEIIALIGAIYGFMKWYYSRPKFIVAPKFHFGNGLRAFRDEENFSISFENKGNIVDNVSPRLKFPKSFQFTRDFPNGRMIEEDNYYVICVNNLGKLTNEEKNITLRVMPPPPGEYTIEVEIRSSYIFKVKKKLKIPVIKP